MNVFFRAFVLAGALSALAVPVLAAPAIRQNATLQDRDGLVAAAFGSGPEVLLSKKHGQSEGDFKRACDKRNGLVTKRADKVVCVARMHVGSMRGSYGGGRYKGPPPETLPPQARAAARLATEGERS